MRLGGTPRGIRKDILAVIRAAPPFDGGGGKAGGSPLTVFIFYKAINIINKLNFYISQVR